MIFDIIAAASSKALWIIEIGYSIALQKPRQSRRFLP